MSGEERAERPVTERDSLDFRDRIYQPTLRPLHPRLLPHKEFIYLRNQHFEGSCTGFALAAVIDYLAREQRHRNPSLPEPQPVSTRMLYEMAKRHDRWPGESYQGSSARGTIKGWHKNGCCTEAEWPYEPGHPGHLTAERQHQALKRPLGAYYRVLRKRSDLHAALVEVPALFATAATHSGWQEPQDGIIRFRSDAEPTGGHAFAILGYTEQGFIVQNSWGPDWGGITLDGTRYTGLALWTYEDFEANLWDAWAVQMALPVNSLRSLLGTRYVDRPGGTQAVEVAPPRHEIRAHYVHIDDGAFDPQGDYPSSAEEMEEILETTLNNRPKHLLLYAHGGLNSVKGSAARVGAWREVFAANGIHELHFIWETGLWEELRDVLVGKESFAEGRAGGVTDWTDVWLERATHPLGHALWDEMHSGAERAFQADRAGSQVLDWLIGGLQQMGPDRPNIHLVGHSAGAIWLGHLLSRWRTLSGPMIANLILFAPACTHAFYEEHLRAALARRTSPVERLSHFLLSNQREQDDHVGYVYRKSLLYLVSRSYQRKGEIVPLMGMQKYLEDLPSTGVRGRTTTHIAGSHPAKTNSTSHGGFDNDPATMNTMLQTVLGQQPSQPFEEDHLTGY